MKPLVFDATPLIYLTRVGLLKIIETLPTRKFVSRSVFREVVERGISKGLADALALADCFDAKAIGILEASDTAFLRTLKKIRGLEEPDAETLALAKERDYSAVVDDLIARKVARTYSIDFMGTPSILILSINNRLLTKQDAINAVEGMIESGWRCTAELYRKIVAAIRQC